jgi:hypothetical protein
MDLISEQIFAPPHVALPGKCLLFVLRKEIACIPQIAEATTEKPEEKYDLNDEK